MRITGVQLKNIACFEDLSLDFTKDETGKAAQWVVILGENGTGKSTLLQMITVALLSLQNIDAIAGDVDWLSYCRKPVEKTYDTYSTISVLPDARDTQLSSTGQDSSGFESVEASLFWAEVNVTRPPLGRRVTTMFPVVPVLHDEEIDRGWFSCGYGSPRKLSGQRPTDRGALPTLDDSAKPYRFASLFGNAAGMTDVPDWIAGLYFSSIYTPHTQVDERRYSIACEALVRTLPYITSVEVTKDRRVMVTEGNTNVPLERLSDGYRGTLAWIGDLIRRLFDAYPDSDDPLQESGVVLVDEIDLHLHPKWQRSVVEDVRNLFPNLQFIVTSHSPFVAQDMKPEDKIIVLERSGKDGKGPVAVRHQEQGSLEGWSADQILSSYFGLKNGTRGEATQKAEARYIRLLEIEVAGNLTPNQSKELKRLRGRIDKIPVGETPDERAFYQTADAVIESLRQRRNDLEAARAGSLGSKNGNNG